MSVFEFGLFLKNKSLNDFQSWQFYYNIMAYEGWSKDSLSIGENGVIWVNRKIEIVFCFRLLKINDLKTIKTIKQTIKLKRKRKKMGKDYGIVCFHVLLREFCFRKDKLKFWFRKEVIYFDFFIFYLLAFSSSFHLTQETARESCENIQYPLTFLKHLCAFCLKEVISSKVMLRGNFMLK